MKNKIIVIFMMILILFFINSNVYAEVSLDKVLYNFKYTTTDSKVDIDEINNDALPVLQGTFGLEGNSIKKRNRNDEI